MCSFYVVVPCVNLIDKILCLVAVAGSNMLKHFKAVEVAMVFVSQCLVVSCDGELSICTSCFCHRRFPMQNQLAMVL